MSVKMMDISSREIENALDSREFALDGQETDRISQIKQQVTDSKILNERLFRIPLPSSYCWQF